LRYKTSGFSLIELLVVVIVLGILSVMALTKYADFYNDYRLNFSAKLISETVFFAAGYSNFFKKKTTVKFRYISNTLVAEIYSNNLSSDTKLIQRNNIGSNIVIFPTDSGSSAKLPEICFNNNFLISGKANINYPSYYISDLSFGKIGPLITITTTEKKDATLKINSRYYKSIIIYEGTGNTRVYRNGYKTTAYFSH